MRIVVDPGHSGPMEPGACAGTIRECDVVLVIAKLLVDQLNDRGHETYLTRAGDIVIDDLGFRADLANANQADVFVSIHANSAVNAVAHGTETYHYPGSAEGRRLAGCIQLQMIDRLFTADRGVKEANFQVLRETKCTAVLVEAAFISNDADRQVLTTYACQLAAAIAIAEGIDDYFFG